MRNLTRKVAKHDNPNDPQHHRDKAEKKERERREWTSTPALAKEAGATLLNKVGGLGKIGNGFCLRFGTQAENDAFALEYSRPRDGEDEVEFLARRAKATTLSAHRVADDAAYTREIAKLAASRTRYWYETKSRGREVLQSTNFRYGARSMVVTTPPWQQRFLRSLKAEDQEKATLRIANAAGQRCFEVYGYLPWSAGAHWDTDISHIHMEIPVVPPSRDEHDQIRAIPKSRRLLASKWQVGSERIERAFPGLLQGKEREDYLCNKQKLEEDGRPRLDMEIALAVDAEIMRLVREHKYEKQLEADMEGYRSKKLRAMRQAKYKGLFREALKHWESAEVGEQVWHVCYKRLSREAKLAMWRCVPREVRLPIRAFLVAVGWFYSPGRRLMHLTGKTAGKAMTELFLPSTPEKKLPVLK